MTDPARAISPYLRAPEEPIRCAAARALGTLGDENAAPALVQALVDPDPDVRVDAMTALVRCARREDAPAIRRSLEGDPVGEVKTAAVRTLGRLKDEAAAALLRALARDRCESEVAWEEGSWDDWLDVQVAAIQALGDMGAESAVDDLIRARADEGGQDLDHVVFAALAKLPGRGVAALLDFLKDGDAQVRRRALAALPHAGRNRLAPLRDRLVHDPSPGVRRIAVDCLDAGDAALANLALKDTDASVRAAALLRVAASRPDVGRAALAAPEPEVRAAALEAPGAHAALAGEPGLAAKLQTWLRDPDARLAAASAAALPKVMGAAAVSVLRETAAAEERPTEVRLAALESLGTVDSMAVVPVLRAAAADTVRQVRLAALAAAGALTRAGSADVRNAARDLLIDALHGRIRTGEAAGGMDAAHDAAGRAASRSGESGRIAITPEGGLVRAPVPEVSATGTDTDAASRTYPRSTLDAIQAADLPTAIAPDDPPRSRVPGGRGRSRRVPVEGAEDSDGDIRLLAVRVLADCEIDGTEALLAEAAEGARSDLRAAVFETIAQRAAAGMAPTPILETLLLRPLGDDDARVRCAAARGLAKAGRDAAPHLVALLDDPDASARAAAVTAVAAVDPGSVVAGLGDSSPLVRRAAVDAMVAPGRDRFLEDGLRVLVDGGRADSLQDACARHVEVRRRLIGMLGASGVPRPRLRTILEALGGPDSSVLSGSVAR